MLTLIRVVFAVLAGITCVIAGWAGLHALGVQERPRAAGPADVAVPDAPTPTHKPALVPLRAVVDASASQRPTATTGSLTLALRGERPTLALSLQLRRGWSAAPLYTHAVEASNSIGDGNAEPVTMPNLPAGEHLLYLVADNAPTPDSYLVRMPVSIPATTAPIEIDVRVAALLVRVRDAADRAVPRALVQLSRPDDLRWIAPLPATAGFAAPLTDAQGDVTFAPLGAGTYRVRVIDDPTAAIEVTLPAQREVTLRLTTPK